MKLRNKLLLLLYLGSFVCVCKAFPQRPPNLDLLFSKLGHYDSLAVKTYADDSIVTGVLGKLCWEYRFTNMDSALCYCDEALKIAQKNNYTTGIGNTYAQYAQVYNQRGDLTKAMNFFEKTLKIWRFYKQFNPGYYNSIIIKKEAIALNNMASVYLTIGETTTALNLYYQALAIDEKIGNKEGAASRLANIGNVFYGQKQYKKAIEYYFKAIPVFKEAANSKFLSFSYLNIGESYRELGDIQNARAYLSKAGEIATSQGDKQTLSTIYLDLGITYDSEKNYSKAEELYQKSLSLKKETDDKTGIATILGNVGAMYSDRSRFTEAENYLLQSLAIADSINAIKLQKDNHVNLSELYSKTGDYQKALLHHQKAMVANDSLFNQQKTEELTTQTLNYKFAKQQDSTKAEFNKQLALTEANKKLAIAEAEKMRIRAESEKKLAVAEAQTKQITAEADKEKAITESNNRMAVAAAERKQSLAEAAKKIALSNADLEKQKLIRNSVIGGTAAIALIGFFGFRNFKNKRESEKAKLSQQVAETEMKALRSQMNPHFLFNALSSIQSFLLNNQPADANTYLLKFKDLVRLVLENSMHQEVALEDDMKSLELYMQLESIRLDYPFTYQFHIDDTIDMEQTVIPPLILQPFVENAIWHGLQPRLKGGGIINISINKLEDKLYCVVEDNGVGRKMNKTKEHSLVFRKESLGIKLTEERLKIINELKKVKAYFHITDLFSPEHKPCGTRVELTLPFSL